MSPNIPNSNLLLEIYIELNTQNIFSPLFTRQLPNSNQMKTYDTFILDYRSETQINNRCTCIFGMHYLKINVGVLCEKQLWLPLRGLGASIYYLVPAFGYLLSHSKPIITLCFLVNLPHHVENGSSTLNFFLFYWMNYQYVMTFMMFDVLIFYIHIFFYIKSMIIESIKIN